MKIELLKVKELLLKYFTGDFCKHIVITIILIVVSIIVNIFYQECKTWEKCQNSSREVNATVIDRSKRYSDKEGKSRYYFVIRRDVDNKIDNNYEVSIEEYYSKTKRVTFTEYRSSWDPNYFESNLLKYLSISILILAIGYFMGILGYYNEKEFMNSVGSIIMCFGLLGTTTLIFVILL